MALKIEYVPVGDLKEYARNARTHDVDQVAQIAASISEFGFTNPVLIDENNELIAGHGRTQAAITIGLQEVPAIRLEGLSDAQKRALRISDNSIALNSGWDLELLAQEVQGLDLEGFDLDILGFSDEFLNDLIDGIDGGGDPDEGDGEAREEKIPELTKEAISKPGDIWILGRHRVVCGDATSPDSWDCLGDVSGAVVFTSPPYGAAGSAGIRDTYVKGVTRIASLYNSHADKPDSWAALMDTWTDIAIVRTAAIFCNVQMISGNKRALSLWAAKWVDHLVDVILWVKPNPPPQMQRNVLNNSFEYIYVLSEKPGATRMIPFSDFKGDKKNIIEHPVSSNEFSDVHRAVMPLGVAKEIVRLCSEAEVFVDPFGGVGTTLIACDAEGRSARLIELDPKYVDVIIKRWQKDTGLKASLESTGELFDDLANKRVKTSG